MSQNTNNLTQDQQLQDNFIEKYNFSRRMIDHRVHQDFNYSQNSTKPIIHYKAKFQQIKADLISHFGLYYCIGGCVMALGLVFIDGYYREITAEDYRKANHLQFNIQNRPGMNFIFNHGNRRTNKGQWNHNFSCWDSDKNCGRDFDIKEFTN